MRFTTMTPFDQQIHFVEAMYDGFFGHDIIGSETHPLKKAFELYCEMMKEDEGRDEDEEEVLEDLTCAQLKTRLRAINKPVGGRKAELIQRIRDHEKHPDRCVKCDLRFDQWNLITNDDFSPSWDLHCDIGDDEGGLCGACLQKWEDERCSMCNSGEHLVPKEMMWPNHTDCVFCAEPEEYAEEKNISTEEAERISKDIVANSPNGWEY